MSAPVLIAGVGNIFFGDDGFGVEVARRMAMRPKRAEVTTIDFGIGGLQLAFELFEPRALVVIADAMPRGGRPGTLYSVEPSMAAHPGGERSSAGPHGMTLPLVFTQVRAMGGTLPPIVIVGCEPANTSEGIGLSPSVARAVEPALALIDELVDKALSPLIPEELTS